MSTKELKKDEFTSIMEDTMKVADEVAAFQLKRMEPIYAKRREIAQKIDAFWPTAIRNFPEPIFADVETLDHLKDLHVEYDHKRPTYRKITATFKDNDIFTNKTLTKEFVVDPETNEGEIISKTIVEYKAPNKRKISEDREASSFIDWFGDDDHMDGLTITEDIFPNAVSYFRDDFEVEDDEFYEDEDDSEAEIDLDEESDEEPQLKKQKK